MTELSIKHLQTANEKIELQSFALPQNYSNLINKLEQLALGLDSAFNNLSLNHQSTSPLNISFDDLITSADGFINTPAAPLTLPVNIADIGHAHNHEMSDEVQFTRVVSDIWIGVILTLLIVSVIFFICSCFLYHKFQQWKNSYRTNNNAPELCHRCPADFEAESLPSYTIVSGLPTYDDALEEFRKAGIILKPALPMIKIFESETKNPKVFNIGEILNSNSVKSNDSSGTVENVSISSTCSCGTSTAPMGPSYDYRPPTPNLSIKSLCLPQSNSSMTQIIELTPTQLATLSRKRLSLQITFNKGSLRHCSRRPVDLYRTVHHNHFRSRRADLELFSSLQRSSSMQSLAAKQNRMQQHRGSLC